MTNAEQIQIHISERADLLERATRLLKRDSRIAAAWLHGSMGRSTHDEWSDIDLWVVVADGQMEALRAERQEFVSRIGAALLTIEAPQNAPHGGAYLLAMLPGTNGPHILASVSREIKWLVGSSATPPGRHDHPDFAPPTTSSAQMASLRGLIEEMKSLMREVPSLRSATEPDIDVQIDLFLSFIEKELA